jgi:ABC-2 type transport system ATP-binding protein
MTSAIQTQDLTKRYRKVVALDHVSLDVQEGSVYALVGSNGAGKTTSIKILMNLIAATSGHAEVLGIDATSIRGKSYTRIGYVSENQDLPEWMKGGALLDYLRDFYPTWDRDLENSLVKQFELPRERKIKAISRGMKMKLALASALAFHPKLVVLDEPFGGLDPVVRDQLIEGLLERIGETTVFLSSHDLTEIETFASNVGYLEDGKLCFSEDMTSLAARFREVEVTLENARALPVPLPPTWLQAKTGAGVVRFVESRFDEERTRAEIRQAFGHEIRDVAFTAMGLRSIFLAVARKGESVQGAE